MNSAAWRILEPVEVTPPSGACSGGGDSPESWAKALGRTNSMPTAIPAATTRCDERSMGTPDCRPYALPRGQLRPWSQRVAATGVTFPLSPAPVTPQPARPVSACQGNEPSDLSGTCPARGGHASCTGPGPGGNNDDRAPGPASGSPWRDGLEPVRPAHRPHRSSPHLERRGPGAPARSTAPGPVLRQGLHQPAAA